MSLMPFMERGAVDAVITDMPFGCTRCSWDKRPDLKEYWRLVLPLAKERAAHVHFCQTPFDADLGMSAKKMLRYEIIFQRSVLGGFLNARKMPMRGHDKVYVFYKKPPVYNPEMTRGKPYKKGFKATCGCYSTYKPRQNYRNKSGLRFPSSLVRLPADARFHIKGSLPTHSTQKSIHVLRWLVRTYTKPGDLVFDPFMGSGTCAEACVLEGRRFIGIEKEERWFKLALERISRVWGAKQEGKELDRTA